MPFDGPAEREYLLLLGDTAPRSVRMLTAEFCRYSISTLAYTLPPELLTGVAGPAPGEYAFVPRNRLDLAIPLEDLREGSRSSGQIGQEIYGAGGPLAWRGSPHPGWRRISGLPRPIRR